MSTNRTKIDWAYKQAVRIVEAFDTHGGQQRVRNIAAILRRIEKRGADKVLRDLDTEYMG